MTEATPSENLQIVQIICTTIGTIFAGLVGYLTLRLNRKSNQIVHNTKQAAQNTEMVQATLAVNNLDRNEKLETLKSVGEKTNELIKDNQLTLLKDKAELARKLCKVTHDVADCKDADEAERVYKDALLKKNL